ncbi:hypothetical protein [Clostridium septicum]|uniref:Uncharacterized protein n=1 Tax=Clostridium septicum TaxID=1504 RepID=A0A9N7JN90_CLOSE|nr:hypothetical protein [Clostridium septicum]AYE35470.1 hypothetical protein CP523_14105 [Clostridium septicum]MDU1314125.1 hypothetical protein [Clostridium septicum]QAS60857.1 hypothetical protein EI377_09010 [Clostridium septicum]UEC19874.1 hypothetical protein LK444_10660 [Clostridium septicum]USS02066.1 hypothetical protein NH397_06505 [Clostridium septicum]
MGWQERVNEQKEKILKNIEYGKSIGVNKISAIFMLEDAEKDKIEKELITWLILDGYRVELKQDEVKILIIEWNN